MINKENIESHFWAYLEHRLNEEDRIQLELLLSTDKILKQEFEETKGLWLLMQQSTLEIPVDNLQTSFDEMLYQYKATLPKNNPNKISNFFVSVLGAWSFSKLALPILFAIGGFGIGYMVFNSANSNIVADASEVNRLSNEVTELKEMMMLAMLENPKATERMKAVSYTKEMNDVDEKVINALLTTFISDKNDNVRLAALKALTVQAKDSDLLREQLIDALVNEQSPIIQVALADAMVKLQEKESVEPLKKRLRENELDKSVKQKFESTIKLLQA